MLHDAANGVELQPRAFDMLGSLGLDIGAVSPAEIAVAIMAQITERLREEPAADRPLVKAAS